MQRALVLAYHFPPVGGAGVQRTTKFLRYLRGFGWDATVVTGPADSRGQDGIKDASLVTELPADLRIERIETPEPPASTGNRARLERWLRLRSRWSRWWIAEAQAVGVAAGADADLVFASMSPFQSAEAAAAIAARLEIPWVADLRDPWALDEMQAYPTGLHRRLELRRMRRLLGTADTIVMNTPEAAKQLTVSFPELAAKRVVCITNGYDASDFSAPAPTRTDDAFRIIHVGTLHTEQGQQHQRGFVLRRLLGGMLDEVDVYTRSHVYVLEAVERLIADDPSLAARIEVHFGGSLSSSDREKMTSSVVREHGYIAHQEAVDLLRSGDLLFLPMHDLPPGRRARIVPGKTYEYMAAGPPILAAIPEGDARDFLSTLPHAHVCRPKDVEAMMRIIRTELDRPRGGGDGIDRRRSVARFERRELTRQLASAFDATVGARDERRDALTTAA